MTTQHKTQLEATATAQLLGWSLFIQDPKQPSSTFNKNTLEEQEALERQQGSLPVSSITH